MSYTPLKTINGQSIKGTGDLSITGGGGVPYTGATQNVDLGEYGLSTGFVELDTTPTGTPTTQGTISWDVDNNTAQLVMNGTTGRIMEDVFYIAKNQTGVTIPKGTIVMSSGTLGSSGRILIEPFLADGTYPSEYVMGVTAESITNGSDGMVVHFGQIKNVNTSSYVDGDILYASASVAGGFTTTAPTAPNNIVLVAIVIHAATNGIIQVRPTIGSNINKDEGIAISSPTNGQILTYNSTSGLWENTNQPTDPEGWTTIVKSANQDVTNTITPQDDTALQFSVVAGGHYMIEMIITYSSNNNAGDYLFDLAVSAGLMKGWGTCIGLSTTNAIQSIVLQASTAADTNNVTLGTPLSDFDGLSQAVINFSFYCDTNATFVYRFANASASTGRTSRTWKGSILKYKRID